MKFLAHSSLEVLISHYVLHNFLASENYKNSEVSTTKESLDTDMSHDIDEGIDETDHISSESSLMSTTLSITHSHSGVVSENKYVCISSGSAATVGQLECATPEGQEMAAQDGQDGPANLSQVVDDTSVSNIRNTSLEDASRSASADGTENWDLDDGCNSDWNTQVGSQPKECPRYFRAELLTNSDKTERSKCTYLSS